MSLYIFGGEIYSKDSPNTQVSSNSIMRFNFEKNLWDSNYKIDSNISLKKIKANDEEVLVMDL